jgi:5-methylthioadenosine/S-adenosylhomocysteine deaminase
MSKFSNEESRQHMSIFVHKCSYLIHNPEQIERDCDLLIEGNQIKKIGQNLQPPKGVDYIDGSGCVVLPGLINSHTHLYQNFLKGISAGLSLVPWCNQVLFPSVDAIRKVTGTRRDRVAYLWSALAVIEMIRGGITCCIDMDVVYPGVVQAWQDLGFRGVMAYTLTNQWVPAELRVEEDALKHKALEFVERFHQPDGLTKVFLAPSTLFLCTDDFLEWAGEQARRLNLGMQIHVSETAEEVMDAVKQTGCRPVEKLAHLDLLGEQLSAVHCVHIDSHEMDLLQQTGTNVVHCPKSNMKLADGAAPVTAMRRLGIPVSIATDGCASNDLLDMWEEIRSAVMLARLTANDASAINPQEAFRMATVDAARAARVEAGDLQPGKLADVTVVELKLPHLQPFHDIDLFNMLVFCGKAADVRDVIINGTLVMRDRHIINLNEADLLEEAASVEPELFRVRAEYIPTT